MDARERMRAVLQKKISLDALRREIGDVPDRACRAATSGVSVLTIANWWDTESGKVQVSIDRSETIISPIDLI